jgi:CRP/FNR family transcriptional regulator, cyclic AMP receptor protein
MNATPIALSDVAEHPFLRGLSEAHLETLAACAMRVRFNPGDFIFRKGDPANRFYLLITGKVVIEAELGETRATVQTISGGDVLGWSWLFPPYYFEFQARALETTEMMFFYGTRLRDLCDETPELGYQVLTRVAKVVIDRLVSTEKQLVARRCW